MFKLRFKFNFKLNFTSNFKLNFKFIFKLNFKFNFKLRFKFKFRFKFNLKFNFKLIFKLKVDQNSQSIGGSDFKGQSMGEKMEILLEERWFFFNIPEIQKPTKYQSKVKVVICNEINGLPYMPPCQGQAMKNIGISEKKNFLSHSRQFSFSISPESVSTF